MDKLWEQRQDFKVWVPLADSKDREYIYISKFNRQRYHSKIIILHCVSGYPTKESGANVITLKDLQTKFKNYNIINGSMIF